MTIKQTQVFISLHQMGISGENEIFNIFNLFGDEVKRVVRFPQVNVMPLEFYGKLTETR